MPIACLSWPCAPTVTSSKCYGASLMVGTSPAITKQSFLFTKYQVITPQCVCAQIMYPKSLARCVPPKNFILLLPMRSAFIRPSMQCSRIPTRIGLVSSLESYSRPSLTYSRLGRIAKIKIRLTIDHIVTALNSRLYSPAFSYPSIADALRYLTLGAFLFVVDIERYFHSYPTTRNDRGSFCIYY